MRTKLTIHIMVVVLLLCVAGCRGKKKASLQERTALPDKTLYQNGMEFLRKHQFIKARLSFQTLINTYEDSPYLETSKYFIAYSYMREGGVDNQVQAEQSFKDFKLFFPTSEMADDAQASIVTIDMDLMREPGRDAKHTMKAQVEVRRFMQEFPDSAFTPEMKIRQQFVDEVVAMTAYLKGEFYYKKKKYRAAAARLRECVNGNPLFGKRDRALFILGDSLDHLKSYDESAAFYAQLVRGYSFSPYFEKAKECLRKLEKSVPEADEKLSAVNRQTYLADESILSTTMKPLTAALSFVGLGGKNMPWEEMENIRKTAEEERIRSDAGKLNPDATKKKKKGKKDEAAG